MNQKLSKIFFLKNINFIFKYLKNKKKIFFISDYFFKNLKIKKFLVKSENDKNFYTFKNIIDFMINKNYNNETIVISLGGGATGDLSGFISSVYNRGLKYINIPSTLLSQVDSSIGGKNGINSKNAKNMLGTIYLPNYIFICHDLLKTLPKKEIIDGFSEIIKISIINNKNLFKYIKKNNFNFKKVIYFSVLSKLNIVKKNIFDDNKRLYLNLGHTFGHSIEKIFNFKLSHGKSIYMGILLISYFSNLLGFLKKKRFFSIIKIIKKYFKNYLKYFLLIKNKDLFKNIFFDKKNRSGFINLILIKKIGCVFILKIKIKKLKKIFDFQKFIKRIS
ncbi:3-dehydroquinate synthase [Candidatus Vidania fulgoroideorum]